MLAPCQEGKPQNPSLDLPVAVVVRAREGWEPAPPALCFHCRATAELKADTIPDLAMSQESCSARLLIKKPPAPVHFFIVFCKHTQLAQAYCLLSK